MDDADEQILLWSNKYVSAPDTQHPIQLYVAGDAQSSLPIVMLDWLFAGYVKQFSMDESWNICLWWLCEKCTRTCATGTSTHNSSNSPGNLPSKDQVVFSNWWTACSQCGGLYEVEKAGGFVDKSHGGGKTFQGQNLSSLPLLHIPTPNKHIFKMSLAHTHTQHPRHVNRLNLVCSPTPRHIECTSAISSSINSCYDLLYQSYNAQLLPTGWGLDRRRGERGAWNKKKHPPTLVQKKNVSFLTPPRKESLACICERASLCELHEVTMPRDTKVLITKHRLCALSCICPYIDLLDRVDAYITPHLVAPHVKPPGIMPNTDFIPPMRAKKIETTMQHNSTALCRSQYAWMGNTPWWHIYPTWNNRSYDQFGITTTTLCVVEHSTLHFTSCSSFTATTTTTNMAYHQYQHYHTKCNMIKY